MIGKIGRQHACLSPWQQHDSHRKVSSFSVCLSVSSGISRVQIVQIGQESPSGLSSPCPYSCSSFSAQPRARLAHALALLAVGRCAFWLSTTAAALDKAGGRAVLELDSVAAGFLAAVCAGFGSSATHVGSVASERWQSVPSSRHSPASCQKLTRVVLIIVNFITSGSYNGIITRLETRVLKRSRPAGPNRQP